MKKMPIALFSSRAKGELLKQRLSEEGIHAEIHDELRLERLWFVMKGRAGVRLEVPAAEFDRAHRRLLDWGASEDALRDAIRCPECKSLQVDYPQFTRKFFTPNLAMGLAAELGLVDREYYCEDCHYTWPKEGERPRRDRSHMAPYFFIEGVEQTTLHPRQQA